MYSDFLNSSSPLPARPPVKTALLVSGGVLFTVLWILAHVVWAYMAFIANVMANDSGRATGEQQMWLIGGMFAGQVLAGAAGIPAGLAFFWRGRRKRLLGIFAAVFLAGVLCQGIAFFHFFAGM